MRFIRFTAAIGLAVATMALPALTGVAGAQEQAAGRSAVHGAFAEAPTAAKAAQAGRLIVHYRPGASRHLAASTAAAGATAGRDLGAVSARVVDVAAGDEARVAAALAADPGVVAVERDQPVQLAGVPDDPMWPTQWGPALIGAPAAWDVTTGRDGVVVAVLDTGVNAASPDLADALVPGWNAIDGGTDTTDRHGHGTGAAGIIAAAGNNGVGVAGMCWACHVLPVKVMGDNGAGMMSNVAAGIIWATDRGADVISMSLGSDRSSVVLQSAITYAAQKGVLLVAAAGNHGGTNALFPAAYPEVISVAGTDRDDRIYTWSVRGTQTDVAAPGCNATILKDGRPTSYPDYCGTSSATPVVAGALALARSQQPDAPAADLRDALQRTAKSIGSAVTHGRIDVAALLAELGADGLAGEPQRLRLRPVSRGLVVRWRAPADDGGSKILEYVVTATPRAGEPVVVRTKRTSTTLRDLRAGRRYVISVQAVNAAGRGPAASADPITLASTSSRTYTR